MQNSNTKSTLSGTKILKLLLLLAAFLYQPWTTAKDMNNTKENMDVYHEVVRSIKEHEGFRTKPYRDLDGKYAVGYGHRQTAKLGEAITYAEGINLLYRDIDLAVKDAVAFYPGFDTLTRKQKVALIELSYNLGLTNLLQFRRLRLGLGTMDPRIIEASLRESKWASQVQPKRVEAVVQGMTRVKKLNSTQTGGPTNG